MTDPVLIRGVVEDIPAMEESRLTFRLCSGGNRYFIIRLDPSWQSRDILFLDTGQTIEVSGTPLAGQPRHILAQKITICNYPIQRLLNDRKEIKEREHHGNQGI